MLFENNDFDFDLLNLSGLNLDTSQMIFNNQNYYNDMNSNKLYSSKEGFLRGNMWVNEYVPYKGMNYMNLVPTCEREALLYKIMEIDFAINDLNLYLDLHPEDYEVYNQFKKYVTECIRLKDDYSKKYGPLSLEETTKEKYNWINNPWPWDKTGGSMYV